MSSNFLKAGKRLLKGSDFSWDNIEVRFIISTGRTGTTFFADFFSENNFSKTLALHEPDPDLYFVGFNEKLRRHKSRSTILDQIQYQRSGIGQLLHEKKLRTYIESNPYASLLIPELRSFFSKLKFLYVVRDPHTFVVSSYNYYLGLYTPDDYRTHLKATDFADDPYYNKWDKMDRFQKICWNWNKMNEIIWNDIAKKDDYLLVKFEDIFTYSEKRIGSINKVINFFELEQYQMHSTDILLKQFEKQKNISTNELLGKYETWGDEKKSQFHSLVAPMATRLGYQLKD